MIDEVEKLVIALLVFFIGGTILIIAIDPTLRQQALDGLSSGNSKTVSQQEIKDEGYSIEQNGEDVLLINDETGEIIKNEGIIINNNGTVNVTINIDNIENVENLTVTELLEYLQKEEP